MIARISSRTALILTAAIALMPLGSASASDETIPPRSWIYPALRTFETLGLVDLGTAAPYTRSQIEAYVDRILEAADAEGAELTPRQEFLLGRLREEYAGKGDEPGERENRPVWIVRDGGDFFALDVAAGGALVKRVDRKEGEADGSMVPTLLLSLGGAATMEADYILRMGPQRDEAGADDRDPRVKSWRGLTSEYERGYIALSGERWRLQFGRDYIQWGPDGPGGLLVSSTAGSHDHLGFSVSLGRFTLRSFQALLDAYTERRLAGHRLEVRLPARISAGVGETVLYTGRGFDWAYLMPLGAYYANQWNEKDNDNILWSADIKVPVSRGLVLSGELLIDDMQYDDDPPAPDKIGWTIRADALAMPWGHDVEVRASYTRIDIYTYSHRDSLLTSYVTGDGGRETGMLIGDQVGPDADRWLLRIAAPLHPRALLAVEGSWIRRGEGNDMREWEPGEDPDPPFPSGDAVKESIYMASLTIDLGGGSMVEAEGGFRAVSGDGEGEDGEEGFGRLSLIWDF